MKPLLIAAVLAAAVGCNGEPVPFPDDDYVAPYVLAKQKRREYIRTFDEWAHGKPEWPGPRVIQAQWRLHYENAIDLSEAADVAIPVVTKDRTDWRDQRTEGYRIEIDGEVHWAIDESYSRNRSRLITPKGLLEVGTYRTMLVDRVTFVLVEDDPDVTQEQLVAWGDQYAQAVEDWEAREPEAPEGVTPLDRYTYLGDERYDQYRRARRAEEWHDRMNAAREEDGE